MGATKGQAIALGIISILTIIAGIGVFVLLKFTFDAGVAEYGAPLINTFWPYGIPMLIAGLVGLVASIVRNVTAIWSYLVICIACLLTFEVFIGIAFYILLYTASLESTTCNLIDGSLPDSLLVSVRSSSAPCGSPVIGLSQASCAVMVLAWFLMLGGLIISCCATGRCDFKTGATKQQAVALGIISTLTIIAGMVLFVVLKSTFDAGVAEYGAPLINTFWPYGIPVLIAGSVGLIASVVRTVKAIWSYLGIGIVCLQTFIAFVGIAGTYFFFPASLDSSQCYRVDNRCICGLPSSLFSVNPLPCDGAVIGLSQASCAVMIITLFLMLGGLITSCCATCLCGNHNRADPGDKRDHEMQGR